MPRTKRRSTHQSKRIGARRVALGPIAKVTAPRLHRVLERARVTRAIEQALRDGHCWIAAPAGYGKTTALAAFLSSRSRRNVWYRVDAGDQDIASFFYYMNL